jgi:Uncharacterized protein conserved in bacteria (DUF2058)
MSMSLRDQLLQAGLVNERQSKEAERHLRQQQRESMPNTFVRSHGTHFLRWYLGLTGRSNPRASRTPHRGEAIAADR